MLKAKIEFFCKRFGMENEKLVSLIHSGQELTDQETHKSGILDQHE